MKVDNINMNIEITEYFTHFQNWEGDYIKLPTIPNTDNGTHPLFLYLRKRYGL